MIPELQLLDPQFSAVVEDCIQNLRSALDHLAWQLVFASGNTPVPGYTKFPIYSEPPKAELKIEGGVTPEIMQVVEDLQPYKYGDDAAHPLDDLAELSNIDKHRQLIVSRLVLDTAAWDEPSGSPEGQVQAYRGELRGGVEVLRFVFPSRSTMSLTRRSTSTSACAGVKEYGRRCEASR